MSNQCHCGQPIQDVANLCYACGGLLARNLYVIADRWDDLVAALTAVDTGPREDEGKKPKRSTSTGLSLNDAAVKARRACTDVVWFAVQVMRDDYDDQGWTFAPPRVRRDQDATPILARYLAGNAEHFIRRTARETAEEVWRDVDAAERLTFAALRPPAPKIPTGMQCEAHGTSEMGERVPCKGQMEAKLLTDRMPDLVCSEDTTHRITPDVWSRFGWKIAHEGAARRLARRIAG